MGFILKYQTPPGTFLGSKQVHAVTGACLATRKEIFDKVKGFDEKYPLALSDVDYCMKINNKGYECVWLPDVQLYHHESATRGYENTPEKKKRYEKEYKYFKHKWLKILQEKQLDCKDRAAYVCDLMNEGAAMKRNSTPFREG